ncbi:hypothetical protein BD289DRAFT_373318 [Coniella lustricola]|uniref:5-Methylcytosine G/T mismatch-specific DNA glycosylase n=1 Tax=Coniella lustricola TaxID=2025994 RepID=A0A2T3A142_9PEZI|nr:hypothetical protein BD289DRAFT_373318 [Coniella lustricola]
MSPSTRDPDVDSQDPPRDKRRSRKHRSDRDSADKDRDREARRHHKYPSSNPVISTGSYVSQSSSVRRHKTRDVSGSKSRLDDADSMTDLVPELNRSRERVNIPYPSFSKAHSREAVGLGSREDVSSTATASAAGRRTTTGPPTPEATDIGSEDIKRSRSADFSARPSSSRKADRPPSPPDTNLEEKRTRAGSLREREGERPRSRLSASSRPASRADDRSKISFKSKTSSQATFVQSPTSKHFHHAEAGDDEMLRKTRSSKSSLRPSASKRSVSGGTLRPSDPTEIGDDSPESVQDSCSPKTPTNTTPQFPPPPSFHDEKHGIPHHIRFEPPQPVRTPATDFSTATSAAPPPPPPPPPPPLTIQEAPRVDYLMQNGGLPSIAPKNFLAVLPRLNGTRPMNPPLRGADTLFAPFYTLLDQYQTVLNSSGSIAVATGHRTVARRLLDRLENVFNRDLPEEGCSCIMCERSPETHRGLGWGEVLERVSGRVEIPSWPPFDIGILGVKAREDTGDVPARPSSPVKIDPDIAEEFREHYLRQSKKVKMAVDRWLTNCAEAPAPPPQDVDDETLTFAILTSLDQEDRPYFNALLTGSRELQPALRAPTPMRRPRADFVVKSGLALQRLYRLATAPRDAETVCYLVKHPHMHDLLSTICDINPPEWEILISGRFDGFLWSGADDDEAVTPTGGPSRGSTPNLFARPPSRTAAMSPNSIARHTPALGIGRNGTPFSRGATPASFVSGASSTYPGRHPVSNDEESEIAALAELEREIYVGMEALEDAFEALHQRAEMVRTALRQRGAGLSMSLQHRRGYGFGDAGGVQVLPQSGGSASGLDRPAWADESESLASESDDWAMGEEFELRPDDSASNISSSRQRRPRRRDERRGTPAPIREEEEG